MSDFIEDAGGEAPPEPTTAAAPPAGPPQAGPGKKPLRCDAEAVATLREAARRGGKA